MAQANRSTVEQLPPAQELTDAPYELKDLQAPVLRGLALGLFTRVFESWLGGMIYPVLARQSGVTQVLQGIRVPEPPLFAADLSPVTSEPEAQAQPLDRSDADAGPGAAASILAALQRGLLPHCLQLEGPPAAAGAGGGVAAAPLAPWAFSGGPTVVDYARAYRRGSCTPIEVARRIIEFVAAGQAHSPPLSWFVGWSPEQVLEQAEESARRLRSGTARSILEGVPFAVKDVADALPYNTTAGTTFMAKQRPVSADAPYVSTLRSLGALLLGKTTMHEIGLGITGLNLRRGTAINPHGLGQPGGAGARHCYYTGGSSSGTAAVLAAGLCPIAIGSDGGGSVRIPASFCGLVGLKPSDGRVGGRGVVEIDCTVATMGPMAGCVQDAALLHAIMSADGPLALEAAGGGSGQMPLLPSPWPEAAASASGAGQQPLKGLRIGVYDKWFDHASPSVVAACRSALAALESCGAEVQAVLVPELEHLRVAHTVTILSEMLHNFRERYDSPHLRAAFNPDVRLALANANFWGPADYLQAQRIRARANTHFRRVLSQVHVIATPTTPLPAPRIHPDALRGGESNLQQVSRVMRFVVAANMLGLPAVSLPVGAVPPAEDEGGHQQQQAGPGGAAAGAAAGVLLPVGLQLIGRPLQEATLLRIGAVLEAAMAKKAPAAAAGSGGPGAFCPPTIHLNPLSGERRGL